MKRIKKMLLGFIILLLLIGLSLFILSKTLSPPVIKELINKELATLSPQSTRIDGQVTWHLFPRPGIKVTQLHIGDDNNTINGALLIENLRFNLQIKPLLQGQFVFKEIQIDGLNLHINSDAKPLITFNTKSESTPIAKKPALFRFNIDRLRITQGKISIIQQQRKITLTNIHIDAKELNLKNELFPLVFKANIIAAASGNKLKAALNYEGKISLAPSTLTTPLMALQHATIEGELIATNLQLNQFKIEHLKAMTNTNKGAIILSPLDLSLYSGKSEGDLSYHLASSTLSINQTATDLNANQFLKDIFDKNLIKGNLNASIHATSNLQNENWQNNFTGKGQFTIKNGTLYFIDLQKLVKDASNKIHAIPTQDNNDIEFSLQQPLLKPTDTHQGSTNFQRLNIRYRLLDGKMMNDSLVLQTQNLELKGQAQVNLNDQQLNGHLSAKLVTADNMLDKIQQLLGGSFPLTLSGKITAPEILPNAREINPVITRYMLQNVLAFPVNQVKDQLQNILSVPQLFFSN